MFAVGEHPESRISIQRCYKRYRDGAWQGVWSRRF
jgi:transposase